MAFTQGSVAIIVILHSFREFFARSGEPSFFFSCLHPNSFHSMMQGPGKLERPSYRFFPDLSVAVSLMNPLAPLNIYNKNWIVSNFYKITPCRTKKADSKDMQFSSTVGQLS